MSSWSFLRRQTVVQCTGVVVLILGSVYLWSTGSSTFQRPVTTQALTLELLVPDAPSAGKDVLIAIWQDAASEEGLPLSPLTYQQWIRRMSHHAPSPGSGLIVPDGAFINPPASMNNSLSRYVEQGGRLLLTYDAGLTTGHSDIANTLSQPLDDMSHMRLEAGQDIWVELAGEAPFFRELGVPPGRTVDGGSPGIERVAGYSYQHHVFPGLRGASYTASLHPLSKPVATPLLWFTDGRPAASLSTHGRGQVLRVNLPLTHLTQQTDAIWLHGFLRYFGKNMVQLPSLSGVPDGIGGLTLNFHCDAKVCEEPMAQLDRMGVFAHGPYSIHVTAGPGQRSATDERGLDLEHNPGFVKFLQRLQKQGHTLASHGGWIHDEFAVRVTEQNAEQYTPYLDNNWRALAHIVNSPQKEYSSPGANNPQWVRRWLQSAGVQGYYTTANMGMGPTRTWYGTQRDAQLWSFPVQSMGAIATVEDAVRAGLHEDVLTGWLTSLVDFCVQQRTSRLVYFHPPGVMMMPNALQRLIELASTYEQLQLFKWRTITELSAFMNRRSQVQWSVQRSPGLGGEASPRITLTAHHPDSLTNMTWEFSKAIVFKPAITHGTARVIEDDTTYRVIAGAGQHLTATITYRN